MTRTVHYFISLLLLAVLLISVTLLNNTFLKGQQIDLTENQVYSLSEGSKRILSDLDEPIDLYFFFSDKTTKSMTSLRTYAERVELLLQTYAAMSGGNVRLHIVDPEPFSEAEDQAAEFGLTGAQFSVVGDAIYFGLAGTNLLDGQQIIGFFDPQQEQFLEYEISKLIYQLSNPAQPHIALVTDLPVTGAPNPMTGRFEPAMTFYTQLQQFNQVSVVSASDETLPEDIDLVMLAHPNNLSESLKIAIDNHLMSNKKLIAFVDPYFESSATDPSGQASDTSLLKAWGINIEESVVLDPKLALEIRGQQGQIISHMGILGLAEGQIDDNDIVTTNFDSINLASAGAITLNAGSKLKVTPLLSSSKLGEESSYETYAEQAQPQNLSRLLTGKGSVKTIGARISGTIPSAFEKGKTVQANLLIYADADMLTDRFWVQQSNFFGETIFTPFANNGDLVFNSIDNLSGSAALISVRSRGTYSRPFERVTELEAKAESLFRKQEEKLQNELEEVENQLAQLQAANTSESFSLSDKESAAIDTFNEKRMTIRRELREVRLQLDRDIAALGNKLKIANILIAPVVLTLFVWGLAQLFRRQAPKVLKEV
jgi:ABC-type uncharacterized transport system involved in gliding motility auxiliary subunit